MDKIKRINTRIVPYIGRVAEVFFNTTTLLDEWQDVLLQNIKNYLLKNRSWNIQKGCLPILDDHEVNEYINSLHWGKYYSNNGHAICWGEEPDDWMESRYNFQEICSIERRGSDVFGNNPWNTDFWMVKVCYNEKECENPPMNYTEAFWP